MSMGLQIPSKTHEVMLIFSCAVVLTHLDLATELKSVTDWYTMGFYLGVPYETLEKIKLSRDPPEQCLVQMLYKWLANDTEASWQAVINALVNTERKILARKIASKFGNVNSHKLYEDYLYLTGLKVPETTNTRQAPDPVSAYNYIYLKYLY